MADQLPGPAARARRSAFARDMGEHRELRDAQALRALTHPVRLQLLQALVLEGPLTATAAAELIGETPTTCSFHFRQLKKYGFVEDDAPPGGRERPWRLARMDHAIPSRTGEPDVDLASGALVRILLEHYIAELRQWWQRSPGYPPDWQEATGFTDMVLFVTPAELRDLRAELYGPQARYTGRIEDPSLRPPGARPVRMLTSTYLIEGGTPGPGGPVSGDPASGDPA
jgi:DNA-binding transcriptional ArsR family regulator